MNHLAHIHLRNRNRTVRAVSCARSKFYSLKQQDTVCRAFFALQLRSPSMVGSGPFDTMTMPHPCLGNDRSIQPPTTIKNEVGGMKHAQEWSRHLQRGAICRLFPPILETWALVDPLLESLNNHHRQQHNRLHFQVPLAPSNATDFSSSP